jgi:hypothetical protein
MRGPWQRRKRSDKKDGVRLVGIGVFVLVAFAWAASVIIINQRLPDHPVTAISVETQVPLRLRHYTSEEELLRAKQQRVEWVKRQEEERAKQHENEKEDKGKDTPNDREEEPRQQQQADHVQPSEVVFFLLTSSSLVETAAGKFRSGYEERIEAAMETWASECDKCRHLIAFCVQYSRV